MLPVKGDPAGSSESQVPSYRLPVRCELQHCHACCGVRQHLSYRVVGRLLAACTDLKTHANPAGCTVDFMTVHTYFCTLEPLSQCVLLCLPAFQ